MYVILVGAYLGELNLIPFRYLQADFFQYLIHILIKDYTPIFCRAHVVKQKYQDIAALPTSRLISLSYFMVCAATCGEIPSKDYRDGGGVVKGKGNEIGD